MCVCCLLFVVCCLLTRFLVCCLFICYVSIVVVIFVFSCSFSSSLIILQRCAARALNSFSTLLSLTIAPPWHTFSPPAPEPPRLSIYQLGETNLSGLVPERALRANEVLTFEANWDLAHCKVRLFVEAQGGAPRKMLLCSDPLKRGGRSLVSRPASGGGGASGGRRLTVGDRVMLAGPCSKSGLAEGEIGVICKVSTAVFWSAPLPPSLSLSLRLLRAACTAAVCAAARNPS